MDYYSAIKNSIINTRQNMVKSHRHGELKKLDPKRTLTV